MKFFNSFNTDQISENISQGTELKGINIFSESTLPSESDLAHTAKKSDEHVYFHSSECVGATDISNNSEMQIQAMLIDSSADDNSSKDEMCTGKLVFDLNDKSLEEFRAEHLGIDIGLKEEKLNPESIYDFENAQSSHCDISNSSSQNLDHESLSSKVTSSHSDISKDSSPSCNSILITDTKSSENIKDTGCGDTTEAGKGTFFVPYSDKGDQSDSDSVFLDSTKEINAAVTSLGSGDDPSTNRVHVHLDNNFNTFQYWRSPLPEVNIDLDIINGQPTNIHVVAKVKDEDSKKVYASEINVSISGSLKARADNVIDSLSGLSLGSSITQSFSNSSYATSEIEKSGVRIHTASVSTVSDVADETVAHIGSTHVLGQHLGEQHLAIVDGVVQGK